MGTAARIRHFRIAAGKSASEVAAHLGLNDAWYHDLEQHDDELVSTLTLFQAMELASILGVRLRDLVAETSQAGEPVSLPELASLLRTHVARHGISLDEFEHQVGWKLEDFLQSPIKAAAELPIMFIEALTAGLGINWTSVIPDENAV